MHCLIFVLVPLIDMALLLYVADLLGFKETIALVIGTGIIGAVVAKHQGVMVLSAIQKDLQEGRMPTDHLVSGLLVLVGAAFLLTPGLITDLTGFLLMIPGNRRLLCKWVKKRLSSHIQVHTLGGAGGYPFQGPENYPGGVRETSARVVDDEKGPHVQSPDESR